MVVALGKTIQLRRRFGWSTESRYGLYNLTPALAARDGNGFNSFHKL